MRTKFVDFLKKRPIFLSFLALFFADISVTALSKALSAIHWGHWDAIFKPIFAYIVPTLFLVWFLKNKYIFFEHKKIEHKKSNAANLAIFIFIGFRVLMTMIKFVCILILTPKLNEAFFYFNDEDILDFIHTAVFAVVVAPLNEELFFRGIIANAVADKYAKTKKGVVFCVLFSGIFFGFSHLSNVFLFEINIEAIMNAVWQSVHASCFGLFVSALYLRKRNIYIPILLHIMQDVFEFVLEDFLMVRLSINGGANNEVYIAAMNEILQWKIWMSCVLYVLLTWLVLRKNGFSEIIANFKKEA